MPDVNPYLGRKNKFLRLSSNEQSKCSRRQSLKASIQVIVKPDLYEQSLIRKLSPETNTDVANFYEEPNPCEERAGAREILRRNSAMTASLGPNRRKEFRNRNMIDSDKVLTTENNLLAANRKRYKTVDGIDFKYLSPMQLKYQPCNGNTEETNDTVMTQNLTCRDVPLPLPPTTSGESCDLKRELVVYPYKSEAIFNDKYEIKSEECVRNNFPLHRKSANRRAIASADKSCIRPVLPSRCRNATSAIHETTQKPPSNLPAIVSDTIKCNGLPYESPHANNELAARGETRSAAKEVSGVTGEPYDDEEYVEDLAQLDVLLHYVNNLSASLEFLDWEKNKRISTDLVPTLLGIYDALYAKFTDSPEDQTTSTDTKTNGRETSHVFHESVNQSCEVDLTASDGTEKHSEQISGDIGNREIFKSSSHADNKIEPSCAHLKKPNECWELGDKSTCEPRGEPDNSLMGSAASECYSADRCEIDASPCLGCRTRPSAAVAIISEPQDSFPEGMLPSHRRLSVPRQMSHPNVSHIPPRSPIYPRRLSPSTTGDVAVVNPTSGSSLSFSSKINSSDNKTACIVRPLSAVSSSSSSSSNSLRRGHAGINTSYLASVESLVEAEEETEASPASGRRREKSLKVRRDFRSQLSRPGSCDSGVAQCHALPALSSPSSSSSAPPSGSHHYPHHLLQRHHLHHPAYDEGRPLSHMDLLVMEVLDTEASYVHGLMEVIQGYLEPWLRSEDRGVSPLQATELFSNLTEIYDFNRLLLRELESCGVDPVLLARIFVRNNAGFSIYTQYCTHYPRTVSLLTELMSNEESVACFRRRQQALGHTLPLGSYLLKPVQRILKYHLLLENILKNFDGEKNSDGYNVILNARNAMTGMAHHINDMKRKHEHCVRVQEIQSLLYGWMGADLTTFGELAAEGTFRIVSAKGIRHVFLFSKMLLICKKKIENILVYKAHIMCSNLMLIESIPREPLCFQVIPFDNPRLQYTLQARNREHKHEWTQQLKRLILENYSAEIPPHARQLVMELGRAKQDEVLPASSSGRRQVTSAGPEYLQKRKRRGRRASEVPSTPATGSSRLRLRRLSKDSAESGRSRSASRGRDTEEDDDGQRSLVPIIDRPKLRLNMWRRRSEPNVQKNNPSLETPTTPSSVYSTVPSTPDTPATESASGADFPGCSHEPLPSPEVQMDSLSISECERDDNSNDSKRADEEDGESTQENLEEIVSQLLQHNLHLRKLLLNKHRRGLQSRKRNRGIAAGHVSNTASETSDTENDDVISHDSGLPITSINSLNSINHVPPPHETANVCMTHETGVEPNLNVDVSEKLSENNVEYYLDRHGKNCRDDGDYMARNPDSAPRETGSSSECTSVYSSAVSISQNNCPTKSNSTKTVDICTRGLSDFGARRAAAFRTSNSSFDNLSNTWSSVRGATPERRFMDNSSVGSNCSIKCTAGESGIARSSELRRLSVRRVQSFSSETSLDKRYLSCDARDVATTAEEDTQGSPTSGSKDRRITIAVYDSSGDVIGDHQSDKCSVSTSSTLQPSSPNESTVCEDTFTDCSENISLGGTLDVHPEHKIYTSAILSRSSLMNMMNKLINARKSFTQDEVSSVASGRETPSEKTPGKMVYTMARQCTKTLKERIKQIRSEEECSTVTSTRPLISSPILKPTFSGPVKNDSCDKSTRALLEINSMSQYKQGSSTIGEKLATINTVNVKNDQNSIESNIETGVASLLSPDDGTSTCKNSSPSDTLNGLDELNLDDSSGSLEEFDGENSGGDSYYERSFEVIEDMLENDLFRDSAIYSDPEDPDSKVSVSDLTKNFPRSILNRVSKSPSVRSDRSNSSGLNSLPRRSPSFKSTVSKSGLNKDLVDKESNPEANDVCQTTVVTSDGLLHNECDSSEKTAVGYGKSDVAASSNVCTPVTILQKSAGNSSDANFKSSDKVTVSNFMAESLSSELHKESKENEILLNPGSVTSDKCISIGSSTLTSHFHEVLAVIPSGSRDRDINACINSSFVLDTSKSEITDEKDGKATVSVTDERTTLSSPKIPCATKISPVRADSPRKKTPPPVPAKPEKVCSKASRNCGSKILTHLKNLEESSKFSRTTNSPVIELDGIKSLEERRKELKSSTEVNWHSRETHSKIVNIRENNASSENGDESSTSNTIVNRESLESSTEKHKVPSSPLMSVRSFVSRNVANVTTSIRSSRATSRHTTILSSAVENNKLPPVNNPIKTSVEGAEDEGHSCEKLDKGIIHTRSPVQSISITRRKSIRNIGNYIIKFNTRSSSVPPKLHERSENRQSSLPAKSLIGSNSDSGADTSSADEARNDVQQKISSSTSFPENIVSSVELGSLPCEPSRKSSGSVGPLSLPSSNTDSDDSSSSRTAGVVIQKRRPKGWVRHVVGKLQQSENASKPNAPVTEVEVG
ncbi:uncharacterized protein LOC108669569 isoform X2 [Hyalella azteca]|uniref:Uncharacterized protein LOC108669569 isoform X2 n=1 Tax=Hyalella azteca TaxID=294128 RepID=A0A8B7NFN7_HYAAZ|nr:uncharacterized protein LOC108669569 isoform X2 [Hyalella azteca]